MSVHSWLKYDSYQILFHSFVSVHSYKNQFIFSKFEACNEPIGYNINIQVKN